MKVGNWYYDYGRCTRSDRKSIHGTIEVAWNGLTLRNSDRTKHMDIELSEEEIDEVIHILSHFKKLKADEKLIQKG